MFYQGSQFGSESGYIPANQLTPSAFHDFSDGVVQKWINLMDAVDAINGSNLLVVTLGEDMEKKNVENTSKLYANLLREPTKTVFQKYITEHPTQFMGLSVIPTKQTYEIRESEPFVDTAFNNIMYTLDGLFPLTPIYGPHPVYSHEDYLARKNIGFCNTCKKGNSYLKHRRILFPNNIKILNRFVEYTGPLILDSSINDICYRSLLYIADKRKLLKKETHVICGYSTLDRPVRSYTPCNLFPRPFGKCKNYIKKPDVFKLYYMGSSAPKPTQQLVDKQYELIALANKYANNLLEVQY
jgi:hypothetical protein